MIKITIFIASLFMPLAIFAQGGNTGMGKELADIESISQSLLALEKRSDALNVYINYAGTFQSAYNTGSWNSAFKAKFCRFELKGNLSNELYYRFRQRITPVTPSSTHDNYSNGTDILFVGYKFNDHFAVEGGKIIQHWGGFDYDENPLYIYEYSDMLNHMDIFTAGLTFYWRPSESQEFVFEASNPISSSFESTYGTVVNVATEAIGDYSRVYGAKFPLALLANWNGTFANGTILTRFAVGGISQTDKLGTIHASGGVRLNLFRFQAYIDYMYEKNGLDRLGIASADFGLSGGNRLGNVYYTSLIAKGFWQFCPGWNLVAKGGLDTVSATAVGNYRKSFLGLFSLEYYPVKGQDLRIFLSGLSRKAAFSQESGLTPFSDARVEMGIIYRIKCY